MSGNFFVHQQTEKQFVENWHLSTANLWVKFSALFMFYMLNFYQFTLATLSEEQGCTRLCV